jgi:hypothetical protein
MPEPITTTLNHRCKEASSTLYVSYQNDRPYNEIPLHELLRRQSRINAGLINPSKVSVGILRVGYEQGLNRIKPNFCGLINLYGTAGKTLIRSKLVINRVWATVQTGLSGD